MNVFESVKAIAWQQLQCVDIGETHVDQAVLWYTSIIAGIQLDQLAKQTIIYQLLNKNFKINDKSRLLDSRTLSISVWSFSWTDPYLG